MTEPFCSDCPDREACSQGWPCEEVRAVADRGEVQVADPKRYRRRGLLRRLFSYVAGGIAYAATLAVGHLFFVRPTRPEQAAVLVAFLVAIGVAELVRSL